MDLGRCDLAGYAAAIAPSIEDIDARIAVGQRGGWTDHKKVAMASIGVAAAGYLMMYLWKDLTLPISSPPNGARSPAPAALLLTG